MLIAFEGIDGSGKSTQLKKVSEFLNNNDIKNITTCEPTKGIHGLKIRNSNKRLSLEEEKKEFLLDRIDHFNYIKDYIKSNYIVLTDRYYYSSMAYQASQEAYIKSINNKLNYNSFLKESIESIKLENESVVQKADVIFYFDIPVLDAILRINNNREIRDFFETTGNLNRVYKAYKDVLNVVSNSSETKIIKINALLSEEEIFELIVLELKNLSIC